MLRIEKIFEEEGIRSEIEAYAPLVPDGSNWKATVLIEYPDPHERKRELARLIGVEDRLFVEVEGHPRVYAIADEDLDRENAEKTSAVHFARFEFTPAAREAVRAGCPGAREIGDRRAAIREAIEMMGDGDVVIIAGKGHEQGQIVGGVTHPFDDATEAVEALRIHA
jgi:hypothetical protein